MQDRDVSIHHYVITGVIRTPSVFAPQPLKATPYQFLFPNFPNLKIPPPIQIPPPEFQPLPS
jgi:hypothetical protein